MPIVIKRERETSVKHAKNFASTKSNLFFGRLKSTSIVSCFFSSLHIFIVRADTKKIKVIGNHSKSGLMSAIFLAKKLSIQKNAKRFTARKQRMKI